MGTVARWLLPVVLAGLFAETLLAQTIRGRVVDRDTGQPLPGAHVVMLHTDPLRGTTTDGEGWFVLGGLAPGRYDLRISFLGYEPVVLSGVLVSAGQETVLEIALKEQVITGAAVVVTPAVEPARPLNDFALLSARLFRRRNPSLCRGPGRSGSNGRRVCRYYQWRRHSGQCPDHSG